MSSFPLIWQEEDCSSFETYSVASQGASIPKSQFIIKKQKRKCVYVVILGRIRSTTFAVEKLQMFHIISLFVCVCVCVCVCL